MIKKKSHPSASPAPFFPLPGSSSNNKSGDALLDLVLEALTRDQVGDIVVVGLLLGLLHVLVALGELAERCERVGSELVEDSGDELGQLLVLTVAVDGKGVGGNRGVN